MIRPLVFMLLSVSLASPAAALSCLRPDVARTYQQAAEATERYVVVHGMLSFAESRLPKANGNDSPPETRIPARLSGMALSKTGFDHPFERDITLLVHCFGPWCGGAASGVSYLGFVQADPDTGYVLSVDPCGGLGFPEPTPDMLRTVVDCNQGRACVAK